MSDKPIFARYSLAEGHAIDLCRRASSTGCAAYAPFTRNTVIRAEDGTGPAYMVRSCYGGRSDDYELIELSTDEVNACVRAGMLAEAERLDESAAEAEREADDLRVTGKQRQRMERIRRQAEDDRARAEALRENVARGNFVDALAEAS